MYIFVKNLNDMKTENKKPENPFAFPSLDFSDGMTLRDYFAGKAMQGILNNGLTINDASKVNEAYEVVAYNSYLLADAMLKQREL